MSLFLMDTNRLTIIKKIIYSIYIFIYIKIPLYQASLDDSDTMQLF